MKRQNKGCGRRNTESLKLVMAYLHRESQLEAACMKHNLQQKADGRSLDAEQRVGAGGALHTAKSAVEEKGEKHQDNRHRVWLQERQCHVVQEGSRGDETADNSEPETESA